MSKEIEEVFKEWLKEKPMAKILVTENSQMGYIIEFAEYYSKQKIEQLEKEVERLGNYVSRKVETRDLKKYSELEQENTKLKERVKELEVNNTLTVLQSYYSKIELNKLDIYDILDLIEKDMNYLNQINKQ